MGDILPQETVSPEVKQAVADLVKNPFDWERLARFAAVLLICLAVQKIVMRLLERFIVRAKVERSLHTFLRSGVRIALWFFTLLILAEELGFPVGSLLGLLGIIGLAFSLALQGTLSNLAGGILILTSKPFAVGDYIKAGGVEGTVYDLGLVYTRLRTLDNKIVFVPNGEISGEKITNYTSQPRRRVDLSFDVSYDAPAEGVKACLMEAALEDGRVLRDPAPYVCVAAYKNSSVSFALRAWCATKDYWPVYDGLMERVRAAFDRAGIEMTYDHLNVHLVDGGAGKKE